VREGVVGVVGWPGQRVVGVAGMAGALRCRGSSKRGRWRWTIQGSTSGARICRRNYCENPSWV